MIDTEVAEQEKSTVLTKILDQRIHAKTTERIKSMTSHFNFVLKLGKYQIDIRELTGLHIQDYNDITFEDVNTVL